MLYLGIDLHSKQLTVNLRDESGEVLLRRQVSTRWERVRAFLSEVNQRATGEGGWAAIVEVCGFHDWLLRELESHGCQRILLVQASTRNRKKTDRRDAHALAETLWSNRHRLDQERPVGGLRCVSPPSEEDAQARQVTSLRQRLGQLRTRTLNKVQRLLLKHNLNQDCPTKTLQTKAARRWLAGLSLPEADRLEMDLLLAQWELWEEQLEAVEAKIAQQHRSHPVARLLSTAPGLGGYSSLALASRMDRIERFARPGSLANYWGLTPGCRNSGEATQRLGSITKEGSPLARFLLGQQVLHVLRRDAAMKQWYQKIRRRRGSKIARVAVMRRLATTFWRMATHNLAYHEARSPSEQAESNPGVI